MTVKLMTALSWMIDPLFATKLADSSAHGYESTRPIGVSLCHLPQFAS